MLASDRISYFGTNNAASVWPFVNKLDTFGENEGARHRCRRVGLYSPVRDLAQRPLDFFTRCSPVFRQSR
jgi:hypothetical protein